MVSLSIGSIISYLKSDSGYQRDFSLEHVSVNMIGIQYDDAPDELFDEYLGNVNLKEISLIAISAYVWNEYLINPLTQYLRRNGFAGKIVLGGYQVTYAEADSLNVDYPEVDFFISGYAEKSFLDLIKDKVELRGKSLITSKINFEEIPSPYLHGVIDVIPGQEMLRMETKRGCPYRCSFCAHRDLQNNKLYMGELEKAKAELSLFKEKGVRRINVLDPVFNVGNTYIPILEEIARLGFEDTVFTFQTRIERIKGEEGELFLSLISQIGGHLEFGVQTIIKEEFNVIRRPNDVEHIDRVISRLNQMDITYEVSLIYGLPNQTKHSFRRSIEFFRDLGCEKIMAFPLMLLKGTELYAEKEKYQLLEEPMGEFQIPVVVSGNTFTKSDWLEMKQIAIGMEHPERVS